MQRRAREMEAVAIFFDSDAACPANFSDSLYAFYAENFGVFGSCLCFHDKPHKLQAFAPIKKESREALAFFFKLTHLSNHVAIYLYPICDDLFYQKHVW